MKIAFVNRDKTGNEGAGSALTPRYLFLELKSRRLDSSLWASAS